MADTIRGEAQLQIDSHMHPTSSTFEKSNRPQVLIFCIEVNDMRTLLPWRVVIILKTLSRTTSVLRFIKCKLLQSPDGVALFEAVALHLLLTFIAHPLV